MRGGCVATYQLSVFSALHNATYTLVLTARFVVFVCSHAITRLPLVGVFEIWHLSIFIKFQFDQNVTSPAGTLHEHQRTFVITSLSTLFCRMRTVSDRSCTENENIHFSFIKHFQNFFPFLLFHCNSDCANGPDWYPTVHCRRVTNGPDWYPTVHCRRVTNGPDWYPTVHCHRVTKQGTLLIEQLP